MEIRVIAGLGNPGAKYEDTRHNIGFMVLDRIAIMKNLTWRSGFKGDYCSVLVGKQNVFLLKPATFMNLSGESVGELCRYNKIPFSQLLVVHDELDFSFGKLKLVRGGSAAGHNGIKSIIQHAGGPDFYRLRMGIAGIHRSEIRGHTADYVLSPFTKEEKKELDHFIYEGAELLLKEIES